MWKEFTTIKGHYYSQISHTSFTTSVVTYSIPRSLKEVNSSSCLTLYTQIPLSVIVGLCIQVELFI